MKFLITEKTVLLNLIMPENKNELKKNVFIDRV